MWAGPDITHQDRARGRAVALPEFEAVDAVIGDEIQNSIDVGQRLRMRSVTRLSEPPHECRALGSAVTLPQLVAAWPVVRREEERPTHVGERARVRTLRSRPDVFDECGV